MTKYNYMTPYRLWGLALELSAKSKPFYKQLVVKYYLSNAKAKIIKDTKSMGGDRHKWKDHVGE